MRQTRAKKIRKMVKRIAPNLAPVVYLDPRRQDPVTGKLYLQDNLGPCQRKIYKGMKKLFKDETGNRHGE